MALGTSYSAPTSAASASTASAATPSPHCDQSPLGIFGECPQCAGEMRPEHAHYRCASCGWRDSCCD